MEAVTEQISDLAKQLDNIKQNLGTFPEDAGQPNLDGQQAPMSFASAVSKNLGKRNPTVIYSGMKQVFTDLQEEDFHKRSIVIEGITEIEDATTAQEAKNTDSAVREMLSVIGLEHINFEECHRMPRGRNVPITAPRKIKVLFPSQGCQQVVLGSKSVLGKLESVDWRSVRVRASQSKVEREAGFKLREICRRMNAQLLGEKWNEVLKTSLEKYGIRDDKIFKFARPSPDGNGDASWWKKGTVVKESDYPKSAKDTKGAPLNA